MQHPPQAGAHGLPSIPGYEVLEKIGEGGMGEVYRATQLNLQRDVAIKVLRGPAAPAWQRESRMMAALAHPHVVTIYDAGQTEGHHYLVLEYVAGTSLRARMQYGRPWPVAQALAVLDSIAEALTHIHGQGVLHLDLKPENVLCLPNGQIKITDFGLAMPCADSRWLLEGDLAQGTVDYCSPEQRFGLGFDARCDVFSLAVLAYELLTGRLPGRVYVPASSHNPALPAALDTVLRRGLSRDRKDRYESVTQFRQALAGAVRPPRSWARARAVWAAVALAGLVGILLAFWRWGERGQATSGPAKPTPAPPTRAWVVYKEPGSVSWFAGDAAGDPAGRPDVPLRRVLAKGPVPDDGSGPPVPVWPTPLPALVVASPGTVGFVHPLLDTGLGRRVVAAWPRLAQATVSPRENLLRAGGFDGDCLTTGQHKGEAWRWVPPKERSEHLHIALSRPPDRPDNPALLFSNQDLEQATTPLVCYQRLWTLPPAGATVVVRFRVRGEKFAGRLAVSPSLALVIPKEDTSVEATRLRQRSQEMKPTDVDNHPDRWLYSSRDFITPTAQWQTYCVIWEWPSYPVRTTHRAAIITYRGVGRVWVDDVELFVWKPGEKP